MLQRAANNAYSWWWASHIRTKQSKWLEQSLQDMEEKVQSMLKLIEEDGDSFARRAEMYYKRRPELINSVEESYRAFRALADRYDHLSKELQNANRTIATVYPEQVQFAMEEDDDCATPKIHKNPQIPSTNTSNVPKVPSVPIKDFKGFMTTASKQLQIKKSSNVKDQGKASASVRSGISKDEALEEIDKLQKDILALQTVKEFVKSSYENGLAKYWGIENQIMEMQQKVCSLQDEFNVDTVIDDDEARTLMAGAALRSCQEVLAQLQDKQEKSTMEAREEFKKIEDSRRRLETLRNEYLHDQTNDERRQSEHDKAATSEEKPHNPRDEKNVESLDLSSVESMTVSELTEKIDELVNKVISLETSVSSQAALIDTLKTEAGELHEQIRSLEDEKETVIEGKCDSRTKVRELEEKLNRVQDLNKNVERQNNNLEMDFSEARSNLGSLSDKLSTVKPDEEVEQKEEPPRSCSSDDLKEDHIKEKDVPSDPKTSKIDDKWDAKEEKTEARRPEVSLPEVSLPKEEMTNKCVALLDQRPEDEHVQIRQSNESVIAEARREADKEEGINWQKMLLNGVEDREKILLKEYTALLRNFKDVKKKLRDMEKKEKESQFDTTVQLREFKKAILKRDEEIHHLRERLDLPQAASENFGRNEHSSTPVAKEEEEIKLVYMDDRIASISTVEENFRKDIDLILDENLDFWLRFSTAFHQNQKFKTEVEDLQDEISKLQEKKRQGGSVTTRLKSEVLPIYKHLREIQTELTLWLGQSASLKDELKRRFASLCSIQEEITKALKEEEIRFSSYQAAKFQGEILNMKQENNKVREELETGLQHVSLLQLEIEKTLRKLNEEFGISSDQPQLKHNTSKSRIPLRSFIFGARLKKQKHSIFSYMHPNRKYQILRAGAPMS